MLIEHHVPVFVFTKLRGSLVAIGFFEYKVSEYLGA